jgi:hypothetical protein
MSTMSSLIRKLDPACVVAANKVRAKQEAERAERLAAIEAERVALLEDLKQKARKVKKGGK